MTSNANPQWGLTWQQASPEAGDALAELQLFTVRTAWRQLDELARMRAVGMVRGERL